LVAPGLHDVERLVEHDLLATLEGLHVDRGADVDAQLAPPGEDLHRAVVPRIEEDAESGRRLGQPVDLLLQGDDLISGLLQGRHQTFVLAGHRRQIGLRLVATLFQDPGLAGGFRQLPAQRAYLLLEEGDLCCEVSDLPFALRGPSLSVIASCHAPSPPSQSRATTNDPTYLGAFRNLAERCSSNHNLFSATNSSWLCLVLAAYELPSMSLCRSCFSVVARSSP